MKLNKQTLHQGEDKHLRKQQPLRGAGVGWGRGWRPGAAWATQDKQAAAGGNLPEVHGLSKGHELD